MVRLVDEALRSPGRFNLPQGLATPAITLADPAVGTGTFLLGVLQSIANTVEADEGAGSVPAAITAALQRLIGFEIQFGPFAVAQLRLLAELISLVTHGKHGEDSDEAVGKALSANLRLYIADTLADPDEDGLDSAIHGRHRRIPSRGQPHQAARGDHRRLGQSSV